MKEPHRSYASPSSAREWEKKSSSRLQSLKKFTKFSSQTSRDFQYALQMTSTVVFCFLIAYISGYNQDVVIPWVVPTLSALVIGDTLGGTLLASRIGLVNFVPTSIFVYILQKIGMGYHNYASSAVLFFCITFFIGYANPTTVSRKIALVLPAIYFTTLVTAPRSYITNTFVWDLLGEICVAIAMAIGTSLFVFPRYASTEIHDRFTYAINNTARIFELTIQAMMAKHKAEAEVYLIEADHLFANLLESQDATNVRLYMSQFEPTGLLRSVTRYYEPLYLNFTLEELRGISSTLIWHCNSMMHAVRNIHFNKYHADTVEDSHNAFLQVAEGFKKVILVMQKLDFRLLKDSGSRSAFQDELDACIEELNKLSDAAFEALSLSLKRADQHEREHRIKTPQDSKSFHGLSGLDDPAVVGIAVLSENYLDIPSVNVSAKEQSPSYDLDAMKGGNRLTFSFFAFHFTEMIQLLQNRFHSKSIELSKQTKAKAAKDAQAKVKNYFWEVLLLPWIVYFQGIIKTYMTDYESKVKTGLRTALLMGVALIFVEVPTLADKFEQGQWIMFAMIFSVGDSFGGTIAQMRLRFLGTLFGAIYAYFIYIALTDNETNDDFNLSKNQTLYYVIALCVPFVLMNGMIKQNKSWSYFGSIAVTTALIVTLGRIPYANPIVGNYSLLRIQQNALGICLVFVVSIVSIPVFALDLFKGHLKDVLFLSVKAIEKLQAVYEKDILTHEAVQKSQDNTQFRQQLVQLDQQYNQFLNEVGLDNNQHVLMENSEELVLRGIADGEKLPLPDSTTLRLHAGPISTKELEQISQGHARQKIEYILQENMIINYKLSQQNTYLPQASMESVYGTKPFPEQLYNQVIDTEKKILQFLISIDRILFRIHSFLSINTVQNILVTFVQQFTVHLKQLFTIIKETLQMSLKQVVQSITISDDILWKTLHSLLRMCNCSSITSTAAQPVQTTDNDRNSDSFEKKRYDHAQWMKDLNFHSMKMFVLSQQFNHLIFHDWLTEVLLQSGKLSHGPDNSHEKKEEATQWFEKEAESLQQKLASDESLEGPMDIETGGKEKDKIIEMQSVHHDIPHESSSSSMIIHRLFDVLLTFNGLFYASSQMGKVTIELSNLLFTITELERRKEHNPF